jgi:hypothetical protein
MEKHGKERIDEFGRDVRSRGDGRDGQRVREMGRNQRDEAGHGQRRTGTEESLCMHACFEQMSACAL